MADRAPATILIVEDEDVIAEVLRDYLRQAGYETHRLARGDAVEPWLAAHRADLLLLDLMLPGMDGLAVCRALMGAPSGTAPDTPPGTTPGTTPRPAIVMVTARVEEVDRLLGLELGADDYICKPFSPREVVARVKAVLRRRDLQTRPAGTAERLGGLVIDMPGGRALLDGRDLGLTAVELELLRTLAAQPGRIYTRDQLMDAMYRDERIVADRTVDSHVKKLRRKIDEARPGSGMIVSVYGMGYKFEP